MNGFHKIVMYGAIGLCALLGISLVGQCARAMTAEKAAIAWEDSVRTAQVQIAADAAVASLLRDSANAANTRYLGERKLRLQADAKVAIVLADYQSSIVPRDSVPNSCAPILNEATKCAATVAALLEDVAASQRETASAVKEAALRASEAAKSKERADELQGLIDARPQPSKTIRIPLLDIPFPSVGVGGAFTLDNGSVVFKPGITVGWTVRISKFF